MSTFSSQWLKLREPVDHRSRHPDLQASVITYLDQIALTKKTPLRITDLGSGTGSNLRALAPLIQHPQQWTLVDYDLELLQVAKVTLSEWADECLEVSDTLAKKGLPSSLAPLRIIKGQQQITVDFCCIDLSQEIESVLKLPADLITAAAFFDLVAQDWLVRFCDGLTQPLYTVLSYNGEENWQPPMSTDQSILAAFHAHQQTDKGFGCAAGPAAIRQLEDLLKARHFQTICAPSPWILEEPDRELMQNLVVGSAQAVLATQMVPAELVHHWEKSRLLADQCIIGHTDFFAYVVA